MITKMVHYTCDAGSIRRIDWEAGEPECLDSTPDEWTVAEATAMARRDGWHLGRSDRAICPTCWGAGIRWSAL